MTAHVKKIKPANMDYNLYVYVKKKKERKKEKLISYI